MSTSTILKDSGLRVTQQRVLIYNVLDKHREHPTVEMLYNRVSEYDDTIGIATVYKTIDAFKSHNIVRELKSENSTSRYDINTSSHAHFECSICGHFEDLMDIDINLFVQNTNKQSNHDISSVNIIFNGTCNSCSKN